MSKIQVKHVTGAISLLGSVGVATIIRSSIKNNVEPKSVITKITVGVASWILIAMISEKMNGYVKSEAAELVDSWAKANKEEAPEPTPEA